MSESKLKLQGPIDKYMKSSLYFKVFWLVVAIITYTLNLEAGLLISGATIIYLGVGLFFYIRVKPNLLGSFVDFGAEYSQIQRQIMKELEIPYGLIQEDGKILWTNTEFDSVFSKHSVKNKNVLSIFEDFKPEYLIFDESGRREQRIKYKDKVFKIILKEFSLDNAIEDSNLASFGNEKASLISMYMFDETLVQQLAKENKDERLVSGQIFIDNYDEVLQSVKDTRKTLLVALIDRRINVYFAQYDGIVRKLENDKYFVVFKTKYISKMQTNKFSILDEVKAVNIGNDLPMTISIGIGMGGQSLRENYDLAGMAIDLALGRGGDQAVLKDGSKVYYYGGKSKSVEKNTKVKSRVKATAFRDLIDTKEKIFIMGHQIGDNDSLGAAIGLYRVAQTIGRTSHIVIGEVGNSAKVILDEFKNSDDYDEDMFISGEKAESIIGANDVLIMVDCSKPGYTECPELVKKSYCTVVFDHHRQTDETIDNAHLSYIELSSSSTCEMVVEIIQYINETVKLSKLEASALYSGIMVDTENFLNRTGVRTFEAAAYLRRNGADITKVNDLFKEDIKDCKAKAAAIGEAEVYLDHYAIAICNGKDTSSPTIIGAQTANDLLNIKDVRASFVCTPYNDKIYISARSIGKTNVQVVMEKFGGGGHMNLAGAQLKGNDAKEAVKQIKNKLYQLEQEGDL